MYLIFEVTYLLLNFKVTVKITISLIVYVTVNTIIKLLNAIIEHLNSIVNSDGDIKLYLIFCCIECV